MMKRMTWIGLLLWLTLPAWGTHWEWDFRQPPNANGEYNEAGGASATVRGFARTPQTAGLPCGADGANRLFTGKIAWPEATITVEFTPDATFRAPAVLFAYQENTWNRAHLTVGFDEKQQLYVTVQIKNNQEEKSFSAVSLQPVTITPEPHTVEVSLTSGGMGRLRWDGRVVAEAENALCFSDFTAPPVDEFHPFTSLGSTYAACDIGQPLGGSIQRLTLDSSAGSAGNPAPAAASRTDCNLLAPIVAQPPVVDGDLNEALWRDAEWSIPFLVMGGLSQDINGLWLKAEEKFAAVPTRAAAVLHGDCLYVAFDAAKPRDMELRALEEAGPELWRDDCVEFFIRPPGEGYYQVMVNAAGRATVLHYPHADGGARTTDIPLRAAANADASGFRVEIALPLTALSAEVPEAGTRWSANFAREGATTGGTASWAAVGTSFLAPERFGALVFGSRQAYFRKQAEQLNDATATAPVLALAEQHGDNPAYWVELHNQLDTVRRQLVRQANEGKSLLVWEPDIWGNFSDAETLPFGQPELERLHFEAPTGARVNAGVMVANLTDRPALLRLKFTPAPGSEAIWAKSSLRWREVGFMELNGGAMMPDMLLDLPLGDTVRIAPRQSVLLWADLDTREVPAGEYGGTVELVPAYRGFEAKRFPVALRVSEVDVSDTFVRIFTYDFAGYQKCPALAEFGLNAFFFQAPQHNYPEADAAGKTVWPEFDRRWQSMLDAGIPAEEILVIFYPEFALWSDIEANGKTLKFLEPEWKKLVAERFLRARDYLKERYGIGYDQFVFYTTDEPNGDPADPATKAYVALEAGKWLREVDPNFRLMTNPYQGNPEPYCEMYDILEPFFPPLTTKPGLLECYQQSGKELWSYSIFEKSLGPNAYRRLYWNNMASGIFGAAAFYAMDIANGDPWNSYDESPGSGSVADYASVYTNGPRMMSSRRMEAWHAGSVDLRLVQYCRERLQHLKPEQAQPLQEKLQAIIAASQLPGADFTTLRRRLLKLAEEL